MISKHLYIIFALVLIFILVICIFPRNYECMNENNKIVCFYSYYEKNEQYKNNFIYFLEHGLLDTLDYIIIINGKCTIDIPKKDNILVHNRENKGYDFGAYSYAIKKIDKIYDYYFFINTSVCGPYMEGDWTVPFIKLFNTDVKVVGTSINIWPINSEELKIKHGRSAPYSHVQSMFFCVDKEYFDYLISIHFFNEEEMNNADFEYIITNKEIGLSQHAIQKGWNINSILPKYKDLDYRTLDKDINPTSLNGDPFYLNGYFGETITKEDVIFFKTNRF